MANQFNNKAVLKTGEVIFDLTQDDVKQENVDAGIWFHDKTGERKKDIITPKQAENNIAFTISVNENVI